MKKAITITLLTFALLVSAVGIFIHQMLHQEPPPAVSIAENALATHNLVAISHFNNKRITAIIDYIAGKKNIDPLRYQDVDKQLLTALYYGKPDFKYKLEQVVLGIEASNKKSYFHLIMSGQFDWINIKPILSLHYQVKEQQAHLFTLIAKADTTPKKVCPSHSNDDDLKNKVLFLHVTPDRLVLSNDINSQAVILKRLKKQAKARIDLSRWKKYRTDKLASIGLLLPFRVSYLPDGMVKHLLQKAKTKNPDINAIYTGASISYKHAGILIHTQINANKQWSGLWSDTINHHVEKINQKTSAVSPALMEILSDVKTSAKNDTLNVSLGLQVATFKKIPDVLGEAIAYTLSDGNSNTVSTQSSKERIAKNPWNYQNNLKLAHLPEFNSGNHAITPIYVKGPFALDLNKASFDHELDLLELDVKAQLQMPPINDYWHHSGAKLSLSIDAVFDQKGKQLLRDERCIDKLSGLAKKNHIPEVAFNMSNGHASVNKIVRLKPLAGFLDINKITGQIHFKAPTIVKRIPVELKAGIIIEEENLRILINTVQQQSVSYQLSGDTSKLIEVRALNKQGKTLKNRSSSSVYGLTSTSFSGDIQRLEFFIVHKQVNRKVDFEIYSSDMLSSRKKEVKQIPVLTIPTSFAEKQWNALRKIDVTKIDLSKVKKPLMSKGPVISKFDQSPIVIQMRHNFSSTLSNQPDLEILMPLIPELAHNQSAVELMLARTPGTKKSVQFVKISPRYSAKKRDYVADLTHNKTPYMRLYAKADIGVKKGQKLTDLDGKLMLRLPQTIQTIKLPLPDFNDPRVIEDSLLRLREISADFIPRIQFDFDGHKEFINLIAVTQSGQRIYPAQIDFKNGMWLIQYDLRNDFDYMELILSLEQAFIEYPFKLKPQYPVNN